MPTDLPRVIRFLAIASQDPDAILGSVLPQPLVSSALADWRKLLPGTIGMRGRLRLYLEEYRGRLCAVALVFSGRRPEWVILALAAVPDPGGAEGSFKLLSYMSAAAAQRGQLRLYGAVADAALSAPAAGAARARETFFQAGFYSYTRETWYAAPRAPLRAPAQKLDGHYARRRDAHDLFRATTLELPSGKPITSPVRSYEEHVARALLAEGFREIATAMLFVKELAVRIEEPALAPAVVR